MPIYSPPDEDLVAQVNEAMQAYHERLVEVGVNIDVLEARPRTDETGEPTEVAIKHQGYPALAVIKVRPAKERAEGRGDALLIIDAYKWPEMDKERQLALLDHELTHLSLVHDLEGNLKRDDYGRPKLTLRLHDFSYGWFAEVADRHRAASHEVAQAAKWREDCGQLWFDWADAALPPVKARRKGA